VVVEIFDENRRLQTNLTDVTMQRRLEVTRAKSQGTPISLDSRPASTTNKAATRTISTKINDKMAGIIYNSLRI
jgi:hypothetical protein